jgi:DNA-directed RNA polymerase specialized sigma subunit
MKPRRTREQLRYRPGAESYVAENTGLILATLKRVCPWLSQLVGDFARQVREQYFSVGRESLLKAHRDFDPSLGFEHTTLAVKYLENDFLREAARDKRMRRVVIVEIDESRTCSREMRPDVAAETWESVRRNSTVSLFEEDVCETD